MYQDRILTEQEELYVSRAIQKIAELTAATAEEYSRNDVDEYKVQLAVDLRYSIEVVKYTSLDWEYIEIQEMMDFYTIQASLATFAFVGIDYVPVGSGGIPGVYIWATVPQLNAVNQQSIDRDTALQAAIDAEILARIAGDEFLQEQIDLLGVGGALTVEIVSQVKMGAIIVGQVFPIGTFLQDIWALALAAPAEVNGFTFDTYIDKVKVASELLVTTFSWGLSGSAPINMRLSDSLGVIGNQSISGNSFTPTAPIVYDTSIHRDITWTITADNIEPVTINVSVLYASFYGKSATVDDTPVVVTESSILDGVEYLEETENGITVTPNTSNSEQGFIAVDKEQTGQDFTKWIVDNANFSSIAVGDFILPPTEVLVLGRPYSIYRWGYRSPLTEPLTLSR